jgi:putative tricarboxylic transport membrane protein
LNLPLVGLFIRVLRVPYPLLAPLILLFCIVGAYSVTGRTAEALTMIVFGLVGYAMRKLDFDAAPLVLALILGKPMEEALRQTLALSRGDFTVFLTRPIAAALLACAVVAILASILGALLARHPRTAPGRG